MGLFHVNATQTDVEDRLKRIHWIAEKGMQECVAFDNGIKSEFSNIMMMIEEKLLETRDAKRCDHCDCGMGGENCNYGM